MDNDTIYLFQKHLAELEKIDKQLSEYYFASNDLYDHKVGVYKIFRKLIINLRFINNTIDLSSQQITLALARMIVDHYSILYLLSGHSTRKEQLLRYCLYLIDSLECRINSINDFSPYVKTVPEGVIEGNRISNEHDRKVILVIEKSIVNLELDKLTSSKNITQRNWKFKSDSGKKYNWEELYEISKIPPHFAKAIQNHFSTFTHGLAMTILYSEDNPESTIHAYGFLAMVQSLIGKLMILNYISELKDLKFNDEFTELGNYIWAGLK